MNGQEKLILEINPQKQKQESEFMIISHFCTIRAIRTEGNPYIYSLTWKNITLRLERDGAEAALDDTRALFQPK